MILANNRPTDIIIITYTKGIALKMISFKYFLKFGLTREIILSFLKKCVHGTNIPQKNPTEEARAEPCIPMPALIKIISRNKLITFATTKAIVEILGLLSERVKKHIPGKSKYNGDDQMTILRYSFTNGRRVSFGQIPLTICCINMLPNTITINPKIIFK